MLRRRTMNHRCHITHSRQRGPEGHSWLWAARELLQLGVGLGGEEGGEALQAVGLPSGCESPAAGDQRATEGLGPPVLLPSSLVLV